MYYPLRKKSSDVWSVIASYCTATLVSHQETSPLFDLYSLTTPSARPFKKKKKGEQKLFNVKSKRQIEWKACLSDWSLMGFMEQSIVRSWTPSLVSCKISLYPKPGSFLIVLISLARLLAKSLREGYVCIGRLALIPNLKTNNICITDQ